MIGSVQMYVSMFPCPGFLLMKYFCSNLLGLKIYLSFKVNVQKMLQKIQGRIAIDRFEEINK